MTDADPTTGRHECGDEVAAYALGALDSADAAAFERHLENCAICRDELSAFQQVVNVMPMSAPLHPAPPGLRRRVLDAVADEPRTAAGPARAPRRTTRRFWPVVLGPRLAVGTLLVIAVLAVVTVGLVSSSSPTTRVINAQVTGQGSAQLRLTGGRGELTLENFSPPPAGEIYEVWVQRPKRAPTPTNALFSVTAKGSGQVTVPVNLHGASLVMVTPEPAGGTRVPTHPPVIQASLT